MHWTDWIRLTSPVSTIAFPFEFSPTHYSERGLLILTVVDSGESSCISCGSCEVICPVQAITLSGSVFGHRTNLVFGLDYARCIFCGFCTSSCPVDAIVHTPVFSLAVEYKEDLQIGESGLYGMYTLAA